MPAGTSDPKKKEKNEKKKNAPAHIVGGGTPISTPKRKFLGGVGGGSFFHTSIVATPFEILT